MENEKKCCEKCEYKCGCKNKVSGCLNGGIYWLGFVGALIYYLPQSTSFWSGIVNFFQAVFWPVIMVYKLFTFLK
jgi:hypothetical protein